MREALHRYACPEIFNTDRGCPFTKDEFTGLLKAHDIRISMDGNGSCRDNVFVARLWKTVKDEEVYLKADDSVADAKANLATYLRFYNERRPPSLPGWPDAGRHLLCGTRSRHATGGVRHVEGAPCICGRCAGARRHALIRVCCAIVH